MQITKKGLSPSKNLSDVADAATALANLGGMAAFDYSQTIFFGKSGVDTNDGLSPDQAFLTLGAAITAASALTPAADNVIQVRCLDSGTYTETTNTVPAYVHLYAPTATFASSGANNTLQLEENSRAVVYEAIQNTGGSAAVVGTNSSGPRYFEATRVVAEDASHGIVNFAITTDGVMINKVGTVIVETGTGVVNSTGGHTHIDIEDLYISGNGGVGVNQATSGSVLGRISHLLELGTPTTTIGLDIDAGESTLTVDQLVADTAYDVESGATLNLLAGSVAGTRTNDGTANLVVASDNITTSSNTQTLTNKAITKRVVTTTDDATAVIDVDACDVYELSAVANATEFTLTGTPTDGQKIEIRLKDAGVSKALTWTGFTAIGTTLPAATTAGKWHYIGAEYNLAATAWHVIAVAEQA